MECQHPKVVDGGGTGDERRRKRQWISRILDGRGQWWTLVAAVAARGDCYNGRRWQWAALETDGAVQVSRALRPEMVKAFFY